MNAAPSGDADAELYDLRGLKCPLPVLKTRKRMQALEIGQRIVVLTDDPMATIDVPHFCNETGQTLIETTPDGQGHRFLIEKTV